MTMDVEQRHIELAVDIANEACRNMDGEYDLAAAAKRIARFEATLTPASPGSVEDEAEALRILLEACAPYDTSEIYDPETGTITMNAHVGSGTAIRAITAALQSRDARIVALERERDEARAGWAISAGDCRHHFERANAAEQQIASAREVIEPFTRLRPHKTGDGARGILVPVTVADVRNARTFLASLSPVSGGEGDRA